MSSRTTLLLTALCASLLMSCGGMTSWLDDTDLNKTLQETIPLAELHADAGAVILLDEGTMEISAGEIGLSTFERHRIVRISTPRGQRYANIVVPYGSSTRVDQIQARTIAPGGRIIPLHEKDIFDVSLYPNFIFFSDQRAKIFTMPAIEDGSVIEYMYRLTISDRVFWPSWTFQEDVPVVVSRFKLVKPGDWDLVYRSYGTPVEPTTTKVPSGFRSTHVWEAREVPPLRTEFGMPPASEVASSIAMAPVGFKSWDDIAHWYAGVVGSRNSGGPAVRAAAESLTRGTNSDREKLRRIFEWVRDYVRYVAVEVGVGGYEPHHAEEVFAKRYGDCKDLVMLLSALAGAVDIDVRPVLISTWHRGRPDTTLPSALQFDHLIGYAPHVSPGGVWLDATDKGGVFGRLPWYDRGTDVVVAGTEKEGYRTRTPEDSSDVNRSTLVWQAGIAEDGSALVEGKTILTGALALELRNDLRHADSADIRHWLGTSLAHRCPGMTLLGFDLPSARIPGDTLAIAYRFSAPSFAVKRGTSLILRPWSYGASPLSDHFREEKRTHPIRFRYPSVSELRLVVTPPPGWHGTTATSADSVTASCGRGSWSITDAAGGLSLDMIVKIHAKDLAPVDYPAFRGFLDKVRMRETEEVMFSKRAE